MICSVAGLILDLEFVSCTTVLAYRVARPVTEAPASRCRRGAACCSGSGRSQRCGLEVERVEGKRYGATPKALGTPPGWLCSPVWRGLGLGLETEQQRLAGLLGAGKDAAALGRVRLGERGFAGTPRAGVGASTFPLTRCLPATSAVDHA